MAERRIQNSIHLKPQWSPDKPHNPLLNSGAIMSAAILLNVVNPEMKISEKFDFLSDYIQVGTFRDRLKPMHQVS